MLRVDLTITFLISLIINLDFAKNIDDYFPKLLNKADSLYAENEYLGALELYELALKNIQPKNDNFKDVASLLNKVGYIYIIYKEDNEKAKFYLDQVISIINRFEINDSTILGNFYSNLGVLYAYSRKPDSSLFFYDKALNFRRYSSEKMTTTYANIADVYRYVIFDYINAEYYYELALEVRESGLGKVDPKVGSIYYSLASASRLKGDLSKALTYAYKAQNVFYNNNNNDLYNLSLCNSLLANIFYQQKDIQKAIQNNKKAINLIIDKQGYISSNLPLFYNNQGEYYLELQSPDSSLLYCQKSLNLLRLSKKPNKAETLHLVYDLLGKTYAKKDMYDSSLFYLNQSVDIALKHYGNKHSQTAMSYISIGDCLNEQEKYITALSYYQKALTALVNGFESLNISDNPNISNKGSLSLLIEAMGKKSITLKNYYHKTGEIEYLKDALNCISLFDKALSIHRNSIFRESSKLRIADRFKKVYENAIECIYILYCLEQDKSLLEDAYFFFEKNKALLLLEALKQAELQKTSLPDSIVLLENSLDSELAFYISELDNSQNNKQSQYKSEDLQLKIFEIERKQEKLQDYLQEKYPKYFNVKYADSIHTYSRIEKITKEEGIMFIEYFYGDSAIYALGISDSVSQLVKIEKIDTLNKVLKKFISHMTNELSIDQFEEEFKNYQKLAYYLYKTLIDPLLKNIASNEKIVIVPDGLLSFLPFEALIRKISSKTEEDYKNLHYLLLDYKISYAFSGNILVENIEKKQAKKINKILAMSYAGEADSQLNGTESEVNAITYLPSEERIILKGYNATKDNFKYEASSADILHLAIHGKANHELPHLSNLVFRKNKDRLRDNLFYQYELFNLPIKARLTVLSACETGIGKFYNGEGVFSLARGFMYAGCPNIVTSLWKLEDQATGKIIESFYHHINKGETSENAITQAKIEFINNSDEISAHPKRWAGIIHLGAVNEKIVETRNNNYTKYTLICMTIILLSTNAFFFFKKKNVIHRH